MKSSADKTILTWCSKKIIQMLESPWICIFAGILLQIPPLQLLPKLQKVRNNLWTYRTCKHNHKRRSQILQVQKWQCFFSLVCVYDRPIYAHWIQEKMWILKDLYLCPQALTEESNSQRPIYIRVRSNGSGEFAKTSYLCLPGPTGEENSLSFDCQTKNLKDFRNIEFFFVEFGEEECRGNCRTFYLKLQNLILRLNGTRIISTQQFFFQSAATISWNIPKFQIILRLWEWWWWWWWMDVESIETLTWLMASISAINLSSSVLLYSAMAIDFALSALSFWSSDSSCFVILLDMHSSSLNRGLLMAAMELLPTVYCKTRKKRKRKP